MAFGLNMTELATDLEGGLRNLRAALDDACKSSAFRSALFCTKRLGNFINYGSVQANDDVAAGFTLDALPKLSYFKATADSRITLMHILVVQVSAMDPQVPAAMLTELAS